MIIGAGTGHSVRWENDGIIKRQIANLKVNESKIINLKELALSLFSKRWKKLTPSQQSEVIWSLRTLHRNPPDGIEAEELESRRGSYTIEFRRVKA
jgi:hypothetical protein